MHVYHACTSRQCCLWINLAPKLRRELLGFPIIWWIEVTQIRTGSIQQILPKKRVRPIYTVWNNF